MSRQAEFLEQRRNNRYSRKLCKPLTHVRGCMASTQPLSSGCCLQAQVKPHRTQALRVTYPTFWEDSREESLAGKACLDEEDPRKTESYPTCHRTKYFPSAQEEYLRETQSRKILWPGTGRTHCWLVWNTVTVAWCLVHHLPARLIRDPEDRCLPPNFLSPSHAHAPWQLPRSI